MKNKILLHSLIFALCMFFTNVHAQIKVANSGNVAIAIPDSINPISNLSIGSKGKLGATVSVYQAGSSVGNLYGVLSETNIGTTTDSIFSVSGISKGASQNMYGLYGKVNATAQYVSSLPGGPFVPTGACGVYGIAEGSHDYNYGVCGEMSSDVYGAGIFGTISGKESISRDTYAGYFKGQTKVNGTLFASSFITTLVPILMRSTTEADNAVTNRLLSLQPIQFQARDTIAGTERIHYGIEPQSMQKLFPELVQQDSNDDYNVNYIELIPLLIQKVQELSEEIEELKKVNQGTKSPNRISSHDINDVQAVLYQNNPNPFTIDTKIDYRLPSSTQSAALYIYNMNGLQVAEYPVDVFGVGSVIVSAGSLDAGMYLYSLVADGQIIDTKRMILTK